MKNREKLTFTLVALLVVVVGLSVAYAALSTTFTITANNVTVPSATWNVKFTSCSKAATGAATCGDATVSNGNVTIANTSVSRPGDTCKYTCTITNSGSIAAKFSSVTATVPAGTASSGTAPSCTKSTDNSTITCSVSSTTLVTYKLGTDANCSTTLSTAFTLDAAGAGVTTNAKNVYLCVTYVPTNAVQSNTYTFTNAKYSLTFGQN